MVANTDVKDGFKWKDMPSLLWKSAKQWNEEDVWQLSASVAYYAILALPGLLVILIKLVGFFWDREIATGKLTMELAQLIGYNAADSINQILEAAQSDDDSMIASVLGLATLIFGATGVFAQLQIALNKLWRLKINPKTPWWNILTDRAKSFGFIIALGFLILISFTLSSMINLLVQAIEDQFSMIVGTAALILNFIISLGVVSVMFGLMFRFLPDSLVKWKLIWPGALLTGILFETGKFLLQFYFTTSSPASTYGAAGMIVLLLLWVSYSCLILFYGAVFIKIYIDTYAKGIYPSGKAIKYKEETVVIENGEFLDGKGL